MMIELWITTTRTCGSSSFWHNLIRFGLVVYVSLNYYHFCSHSSSISPHIQVFTMLRCAPSALNPRLRFFLTPLPLASLYVSSVLHPLRDLCIGRSKLVTSSFNVLICVFAESLASRLEVSSSIHNEVTISGILWKSCPIDCYVFHPTTSSSTHSVYLLPGTCLTSGSLRDHIIIFVFLRWTARAFWIVLSLLLLSMQGIVMSNLRFSQLGGLVLERSVRRIVFHFASSNPQVPCRDLFGRLSQIAMILTMEDPSEATDYWDELLSRMTEIEIKRVLSLRRDFRMADINALHWSEPWSGSSFLLLADVTAQLWMTS